MISNKVDNVCVSKNDWLINSLLLVFYYYYDVLFILSVTFAAENI
jgi:hypothetical protein